MHAQNDAFGHPSTAGSIQEDQRKRKPQENALAMVQSLWDNKGLLRSGDTRT